MMLFFLWCSVTVTNWDNAFWEFTPEGYEITDRILSLSVNFTDGNNYQVELFICTENTDKFYGRRIFYSFAIKIFFVKKVSFKDYFIYICDIRSSERQIRIKKKSF